jgi:hypothetical protein
MQPVLEDISVERGRTNAAQPQAMGDWRQESFDRFTRRDGCEVTRCQERGAPPHWIAMVPCPQPAHAWHCLKDSDAGPQKFDSAEAAMRAVEDYLEIYRQFIAQAQGDEIDLTAGISALEAVNHPNIR